MTYADLLEKRQKLNSVNFIPTANSSFIYAVARNKDKMDSVIKSLNKMIEPSENYKEYQRELDELNREFALKEEDGTIAFVTIPTPKGVQRGFKKLVGEGNSESKYEKALVALKEKYKEDIKEQEQRQKTYEAHLQKEVPPEDYRVFFIDADIIPDGLHPVGMEGCMPFIKEPAEGVPEERKKPK